MIKKISQILFIAISFVSITIIAQDSVSVDLRAMVKAQMLQAQSSQMITKESTKTSIKKDSRIFSYPKVPNVAFPKISSGVFKILVLILSAVILISLVILRRVRIQQKIVSKQFKENIRLIREEGLRQPIDFSLTPVRKGLLEKIECCLEEKSITVLARKLKISKGEIHLVNSIKTYGSELTLARNQA